MKRVANKAFEQTNGTPARWMAPFAAQRQRSTHTSRLDNDNTVASRPGETERTLVRDSG
jgi:hypothetical protein